MAELERPFQEDIQVQGEASKPEGASPLPWSAPPLGNYHVIPQLSSFQPEFNFHPVTHLKFSPGAGNCLPRSHCF